MSSYDLINTYSMKQSDLPGESKKYTRLTSRSTASITSTLKIRLGLDRLEIKLSYDTMKVHFSSLLIELSSHKLKA